MWTVIHANIIAAISLAAIGAITAPLSAALLAAAGTIGFGWLAVEGGRPARRIVNMVTAVRPAASIAVLTAIAAGVGPNAVLFWLLVAAELSDFADGFIARRVGSSAFGATLDAESDAFLILALSFVAVAWHGLGRWVIVAGLLRYAVALPFFLLPSPRFPTLFRGFAKFACAVGAIALLVACAPASMLGATARTVAAWIAVALIALSFAFEAVIRIVGALGRRGEPARLTAGVLRSLLTYYAVPLRLLRARSFFGRFVRPGALVIDVGAHVGNRVRAFRSLGASVIAVEPQPVFAELLHRLYGADDDVSIQAVACGAAPGEARLQLDPRHPTLATLSREWVRTIDTHYADVGVRWSESHSVPVRTLDQLIAQHHDRFGVPTFIKIDAEGYEAEILRGLTRPVRCISIEFLPAAIELAREAIEEIERLGEYRFAYSMVESMRLEHDSWMSATDLLRVLQAMPTDGRSGDIYAVRAG